MAAMRRLGVPLLVGLLVAVLLGVPGSGDQARAAVEPRTGTGRIMIPAAAFTPAADGYDYYNAGTLTASSGRGHFTAPLIFPEPVVNIKKVVLYAYDNTDGFVDVLVLRALPSAGTEIALGDVHASNSTADPQVISSAAISPRRVNTAVHSPYLFITVDPNTVFYGVAVLYSY